MRGFLGVVVLGLGLLGARELAAQASEVRFGNAYEQLDARQKALIDDWVARFNDVTDQSFAAEPFYDRYVKLSTKTTFDAVTHALKTTPLSSASGESLGDALDLIETLETVHGKIKNAAGDHQFRIYVRLAEDAIERLEASTEFQRGVDNTVYHKGYPINYRQQGGTPSIQVSIARDERRADIDVDYRSSSFPAALFNGHLTSSNSDVRAGNNHDRHTSRWSGFENWWRSLFGVRFSSDYEDAPPDTALAIPERPRIGDQTIEKMTYDFLTAWLVEGNVMEAMGYVSPRAYACLAEGEGTDFDRGMAPYTLLVRLKAAHEALGQRDSLEGLVLGVRLTRPDLKLVDQPHHPQFVLYSVPDNLAAELDCASRLALGEPMTGSQVYGKYFGATFVVDPGTGRSETVALLWARENGTWKIVSWETEPETEDEPRLHAAPDVEVTKIPADTSLVEAAKDFLESWFIEQDVARTFRYFSPRSYTCYNLLRRPDQPEARSPEEAAQRIREGIERSGRGLGRQGSLDTFLAGVEPVHPAVRLMDHAYSDTFTLTGLPSLIEDWADCSRRDTTAFPDEIPPEYGRLFGMNIRFRTLGGETPVFRAAWIKENGNWRIMAYDIEEP